MGAVAVHGREMPSSQQPPITPKPRGAFLRKKVVTVLFVYKKFYMQYNIIRQKDVVHLELDTVMMIPDS